MTIDTLSTFLVAAGSISAVAGVKSGNRTAYALLASAIFSTMLCEAGVPFHGALWLTIDLCVIMWILIGWADKVLQGSYGRRRDIAVLLIFVAIWPFYFRRDVPWGPAAVDIMVAAQMFLTFPARLTLERVTQWAKGLRGNDDGLLKLALA
jgi:hypothetical protein